MIAGRILERLLKTLILQIRENHFNNKSKNKILIFLQVGGIAYIR